MVNSYIIHILILIAIYIILAVSLDLAMGFTGLLNMGHIAFFGIGAYGSALLTMAGIPYLLALLAGAIIAGASGFLLAVPTTRLKGDYLALGTMGFGFIIESFMRNWISLTRGPLGLPGIPKPSFFGFTVSGMNSYLVFSVIVLLIPSLEIR